MHTLGLIFRGIGSIVLGFLMVILVNLPHDWLLNQVQPGSVVMGVPTTTLAATLSSGLVFLAGVAAGLVVSLVGGTHRKIILLVLAGLFLLSDLLAVLGPLRGAPLWYRVLMVVLVPLQVWIGWRLATKLKSRAGYLATVRQS
ncbi:hypothetical protein FY528_16775 [Hymenobacter lutimineralis]|uniref:Uncharacterized protein n=1 Tax=Hymenobacter lutimineralis TaxID=2606448 RepID=A0A5D6UVD3_9BACT|nr:hypothetical protein [Hymenobacter lutimineralis]TYZ06925.1 hypothetical protein FY528_16775 [Hymenobacter lutimineralis]